MLRPKTGVPTPGDTLLKYASTAAIAALVCAFFSFSDFSAHAMDGDSDSGSSQSDDGDRGGGSGDGDRGGGSGDGDRGGGSGDGDRGGGGGVDGDRGGNNGGNAGGGNTGASVSTFSGAAREDTCRQSTYGSSDVLRQRCNGPFYR